MSLYIFHEFIKYLLNNQFKNQFKNSTQKKSRNTINSLGGLFAVQDALVVQSLILFG